MTDAPSSQPPPGSGRPSHGRSGPPAWFGSRNPWHRAGAPRERGRLPGRRVAVPAIVAVVVGAGVVFAWPNDLHLVSTARTGAAAEPSAGSAGTSASSVAIASPGTPSVPAATQSAVPPATPTQAPAAASAAPSDPGASPAPSSGPPPAGGPILGLQDSPTRRRQQTDPGPVDPALLDGYQWPLPRAIITDPFGPSPWGSRVVNGVLFHDGLDLATVCGDRIVAAHDGTVLAAGRHFDEEIGWVGDLGPYERRLDAKKLWGALPITIVIDDGNGYRSIYAHFWKVVVSPGQVVKAGQLIGYEGATGRATGCHLHYGLFSPQETALFAIEPSVVKRMLVPPYQIARINPLLVLPHRKGDELPTPSPTTGPTASGRPGSSPGPTPTPAPTPNPIDPGGGSID